MVHFPLYAVIIKITLKGLTEPARAEVITTYPKVPQGVPLTHLLCRASRRKAALCCCALLIRWHKAACGWEPRNAPVAVLPTS